MENNEHLSHIRHTLAHLLAQASKEHYPNALLTLGPSIDNGFYYDIDFQEDKINDEDLSKIEKTMKKNLSLWNEFTHKEVTETEAKEIFKDNIYSSNYKMCCKYILICLKIDKNTSDTEYYSSIISKKVLKFDFNSARD